MRIISLGSLERRRTQLRSGLQWGRGFLDAETIKKAAQQWGLHWLQWGRGFLDAETIEQDPRLVAVGRLQWGRGFLDAETLILVAIESTLSLQWGRGFLDAET